MRECKKEEKERKKKKRGVNLVSIKLVSSLINPV